MIKYLAIGASLIFLAGCASRATLIADTPSEGYAKLTVVGHPDFPEEEFGINGVGDPFQFKARQTIYIAKGRRSFWYGCPGFVYTDSGPSISYRFIGGESYELVCSNVVDGRVFIRPSGYGA